MLKPNQRIAINALLAGQTATAAAQAAGVHPNIISRWRKLPEFQEAYQVAQAALVEATHARLLTITTQALTALEAGMSDDQPAAVRVRAADIALAQFIKYHEVLDVASRLEALEATVKVEYVSAPMPE